ncbi:MAG: hypothetical protein ACJ79Y_04510, partial [Myxococcales bacterium]
MVAKARKVRPRAPLRRRKKRTRTAPEPSSAVPPWVAPLLEKARVRAGRRAEELRARYPGEDPRTLGQRLVRSQANRAGLAGGVTA